MHSKNFTPILAIFLVIVLIFVAVQVVSILTSYTLPINSQEKTQQINPTLNQKVFDNLKDNSSN